MRLQCALSAPVLIVPKINSMVYLDETGDVKLEANVEYRFPILGDLYGAAFLDAGNVWLLREQKNEEGVEYTSRRFAYSS